MVRLILLILSVLSPLNFVFAQDAKALNEEILRIFQGFKPSSVLKDYTQNPRETVLKPGEEEMERLKNEGFKALPNHQDSNAIFQGAKTRPRVRFNPNSPEVVFAGHLLERDEDVLNEKCYQKKASCSKEESIKSCDESMHNETKVCGSHLNVSIKSNNTKVSRYFLYGGRPLTVHLNACEAFEPWCKSSDVVVIHQNCEQLNVSVTHNGKNLGLIKGPSCIDPTIVLSLGDTMFPRGESIDIHVEEIVSEDHWTNDECSIVEKNAKEVKCEIEGKEHCKDENQTKIINGIAINRLCWNFEASYRCISKMQGCETLLNESCSQIDSLCIHQTKGYCDAFHQTFSCLKEVCFPEQTICPGKIYCTDGSCDETKVETSDDFGEGVSRLGALAGGAKEVVDKQIVLGSASIFTGVNHRCRIAVANIGNCCGGKERIFNCRTEEQELSKARADGRASLVGTYCEHDAAGLCVEKKESWCVFPTKLAAIFQIEGRLNQLHIPFGHVTENENLADCRGLKPEELEHIHFQALNLKPLEAEWISKMVVPDSTKSDKFNEEHIGELYKKGESHD